MNYYKIKRKQVKRDAEESYYYGTSIVYRMYPNKKQEEWLTEVGNKCRGAYNKLVEEFCQNPDKPRNLPGTSLKEVGRLRHYLKEFDWLDDVPSILLYDVCNNFIRGVDSFYTQIKKNKKILEKDPYATIRKTSPPKKKKSYRDLHFGSNNGNVEQSTTIDYDNNRYYCFANTLKKLGISNSFKIKCHKKFYNSKIKRVSFMRDSSMCWYVSFGLELPQIDRYDKIYIPKDNSLGIDLGVKTAATTSDGVKFHPPVEQIKKLEKKIDVLNKVISRKQKLDKKNYWKSNNYSRVLEKKYRIQKKINNIRANYNEYVSHVLTKGEYNKIQMEDLKLNFMVEKRKKKFGMSRSATRLGLGSLTDKIKSKSQVRGIEFNKINPANTTKSCSNCGHIENSLTLNTREWTCPKCGVDHDRDINAAKNIQKSLDIR